MKLNTLISGITLTAAAVAVSLPSHAGTVRYAGDAQAVAICRAIVEDDAATVKKLVEKSAPRYTSRLVISGQADDFLCNGVTLEAFAAQTGAKDTLAYLGGDGEAKVAGNLTAAADEV